MKEAKHARKKYKIIETYSVLIFIAALFMSIGYAEISGVLLSVNGAVEAATQEGVFIKDILNTSNVNADTANSKINYFIGTLVDSEIVLGDTSDSSITYQVTLYNNSDKDCIFIGVITDESDDTLYSNENIDFNLSGIEEYTTTIESNNSLTFQITFKYKDGTDVSQNTLASKLNFRFKEIPTLVLNDEEQATISDIYPDYTPQGYKFTVSNYTDTEINTVPMSYNLVATIDSPLTAKIYDENDNEVTENISIDGDGITKITHTYNLKIIWDESNPVDGVDYNDSDYADKEFNCSIKLNATPKDEKYLKYAITKEFEVDVKTASFYFNASAGSTNISIKNNAATVAMTVNNYNSNNYNAFSTTYEISIEDNDKFELSNSTNGTITKTISGGSKIQDSFDIGLTADMSDLDLTESLTLKIVLKSPYVIEGDEPIVEIPISITLHKVTVTLNANGGTVSPSSITVYQSRTYADLPTPTRTGHTFNGWYSATSGGTKYVTTTEVTTDASTQTLYAQWTSRLLADYVSVGDYVNYPVNYSNVGTNADGGYIPKTTYTGWRVLSIEGSGDNKYVRLVSAGVPLTYVHPKATSSGPTSVTALTTNFFSTAISSTSTNYKFRKCGFTNSSGTTITTIAQLKTLFTNDYTQISSSTPKVQSMTKDDFDQVYGSEAENGTYVTDNDLLAIPSQTSGYYAAYHLATYTTYDGYQYLWNVRYEGAIIYTNAEHGIRPVVTLKTTVETTGKTSNVWQINT